MCMTVLLLTACNPEGKTDTATTESERLQKQIAAEFEFVCSTVKYPNFGTMQRCVNKEAVCYIWEGHREGGPSCKFLK